MLNVSFCCSVVSISNTFYESAQFSKMSFDVGDLGALLTKCSNIQYNIIIYSYRNALILFIYTISTYAINIIIYSENSHNIMLHIYSLVSLNQKVKMILGF